ncbi:hypothetical protein Syun_011817 [Stephania yunnanensis]|uniref:Uncharacterized protein n=1 Tax=Stephania yunnanensis TaxID=152371 RepID=A0AAP0PFU0_9MAGN
MISCDGFRFEYQFKTPTPNIDRLLTSGTEAHRGLVPVFPTLTLPNHYSLATGLYPVSHGIPLWLTVTNHGLKAAAYYWPGSEAKKGNWTCPPKLCPKFVYNNLTSFEERMSKAYGPDDPRISDAVAHVDRTIGRLIQGLEKKGIFNDVHIILLGDHGMVGLCDNKVVYLEDLAPWVAIPESWVQTHTPLLTIRPTTNVSSADVVAKMKLGLSSGRVENGEYLKVYLREELPDRFVYKGNDLRLGDSDSRTSGGGVYGGAEENREASVWRATWL